MPEESYKIFISYEREDADSYASIIYEKLKLCYGKGVVFKDEQETRTSTIWAPRLDQLVQNCHAFIVVIGFDWTVGRVIDKLNDPESAIHKEIVTAVNANKKIFPVLVEKAMKPSKDQVPEKISHALHGPQHLPFRRNSNLWNDDIERLGKDIEKETGVPWPGLPTVKPPSLDRVLCRLDRYDHIASARTGFEDHHHRLFLAYGASRAGFELFALRCALEFVRGDSQDSPVPKPLTWGLFSAPEDPQGRRRELMIDVAAGVFGCKSSGQGEALEQTLRDYIKNNARPTVVHSTVLQRTNDKGARIQEWFAVWRDLLREDRRRNIAVMLFVESGWWPLAGPDVQRVDCGGCVVSHKMGKISHEHLNEWLKVEVQRLGDDRLRGRLAVAGQRLYRFRWGRHFDDIRDVMLEAMLDSAGADSKASLPRGRPLSSVAEWLQVFR